MLCAQRMKLAREIHPNHKLVDGWISEFDGHDRTNIVVTALSAMVPIKQRMLIFAFPNLSHLTAARDNMRKIIGGGPVPQRIGQLKFHQPASF